MINTKKVLLNCLPPTAAYKPGYSLSIIKPFLVNHGYTATIKYWNLFLRNIISDFWFGREQEVNCSWLFKDLMPFFNYIAQERKDPQALKNINSLLSKHFPGTDTEIHLKNSAIILEHSILEECENIKISEYDYIYVQSKFYKYELISTGVFCQILKNHYPSLITIIEAQEFPNKAMALMDSFDYYDYATWGEYEKPFLALLDTLSNGSDIENVANIIYRNEEGIPQFSKEKTLPAIDLNNTPFADFSDYMEQSDIPIEQIIFPLEGGRGCHWNHCSFCYMNDGYVYRRKTPQRIISEITHYIESYNSSFFYFIDNDLIGDKIEDFKTILSGLAKIKQHHPLKFEFGEIIAKEVNADIVKAISETGFLEIQIGYESTSDISLKLINKKGRFAHLLLASKWSFFYGMSMSPQNILRSMPFETEEIILDNIKNLYYLRFLLSHDDFYHSLRELCVVSTSRYFPSLCKSNMISLWDSTPMQEFMAKDLLKPAYKYDVFLMQTKKFNPLWILFKETEKFYKQNKYTYRLKANYEGKSTTYIEYSNGLEIRKQTLDATEIEIISRCDRRVLSLQDLHAFLPALLIDKLKNKIRQLMDIGIIYMSADCNEIVSIVSLEVHSDPNIIPPNNSE